MKDHKEKYLDLLWVLGMLSAMIEESIYHIDTFAHSLKVHHNDKAAKVFDLICEQFKIEQKIVLNHTLDFELPNIPPWEVPYTGYQHPSTVLIDANYLMSESEAWKLTHELIEIHKGFYSFLVKSHDEGIIYNLVDDLLKHCNKCGGVNKKQKIKADTSHSKTLEDLDVISLHSSEGGLW